VAKTDDRGEGPELSDEEWSEFEKQFTAEAAKSAAYKEPSARQRELTAKWKKEPPKDTGWRTDGPPTGAAPGKSQFTVLPGGKQRRVWRRNFAWALLAAIATGLVIGLPKVLHRSFGAAGTKANGATAYVTPQAVATESGSQVPAAPVGTAGSQSSGPTTPLPPVDVFEGSPATAYADGADGIVLPTAAPIGRYSKKQVADALDQAKQFLVAANLDPQVLLGASPDRVLQMMDPKESLRDEFIKGLSHANYHNDPTYIVTRFAKAETKFASQVVKVHGSIAPALDKAGNLQVKADFLFVYGVAAADGSGQPTREVVRRVLTTTVLDPSRYGVTPGKLWIDDYTDQVDNSPCGINDGFLHPWFPGAAKSPPTTPGPSDSAASASGSATPSASASPSATAIATFDPFDQAKPVAGGDGFGCTSPTRT
jgi:hypothetical protein